MSITRVSGCFLSIKEMLCSETSCNAARKARKIDLTKFHVSLDFLVRFGSSQNEHK